MPKPVTRVSEVRPKQAGFAAGTRQFPRRLSVVSESDSLFDDPLNSSIAGHVGMTNDCPLLRLAAVGMRPALPVDDVRWADEIHRGGTGFRCLAEDVWRPQLNSRFPGRGFA